VRGVHIMAIEWESAVAEIANRAKLLPRPLFEEEKPLPPSRCARPSWSGLKLHLPLPPKMFWRQRGLKRRRSWPQPGKRSSVSAARQEPLPLNWLKQEKTK